MPPAVQQPPNQRLRPFKPTKFGRYTLVLPLATGGMGEVYLARIDGASGFEKYCVIKKILSHLAADTDFVERFIGEARVLAKLSHGNIAQVLDLGHVDGSPYLALEFVDGKDVRRIIARMRDRRLPVPVTFALYTAVRVLEALAYAHRKRGDDDKELGLVHRDISPQNLLVSYEGEVKVIDFGLAKSALSTAKTNPSMVLGKFLYMSPEQARSARVDRRSDLYSLGLCLYELLAGKNPFEDVPPTELLQRVQAPAIPPLSQVEPLCPQALSDVVMRSLSVDPAGRYQSAEEFRAKLLGQLLDLDPGAGPETASRFMREAFATELAQEKKLFAQFRDVVAAEDPKRSETRTEAPAETRLEVEVNPFSDDSTNPGDSVPPPTPSRPERDARALGLDAISPSGKKLKLQTDVAPALPTLGLTPVGSPSVVVDAEPQGTVVEGSGSDTNPVLAKVKSRPKGVDPDKEVTSSAARRLRAPSSRGRPVDSDPGVGQRASDQTLDIDAESDPKAAPLRKLEHTEQDTGEEGASSTDPDARSTALRAKHKGATPRLPALAHDFRKIPLWAWLALPGAALLLVLLFILWDVWSETASRNEDAARRAAEERRIEERRRELLSRSASRPPDDEVVEPLPDISKQRDALERVQKSLEKLRSLNPKAAERWSGRVEGLRARLPGAASDSMFMSDANTYYQSIEVDLSSAREQGEE